MEFINIHTHDLNDEDEIISIKNLFPFEYSVAVNNPKKKYSIGIHPWHINELAVQDELQIINNVSLLENIVAIGECGIDKLKGNEFEIQLKVFKSQAEFAESVEKPLIIHCVKGYNELLVLHNEIKPKQPWIIHGFRQNLNIAKQLVKNGLYISFGNYILYNEKFKAIINSVPADQYFLETDDSMNSTIIDLYKFVSEIRNVSIIAIEKELKRNFNKIFK
jgi:TatD DNase family protein